MLASARAAAQVTTEVRGRVTVAATAAAVSGARVQVLNGTTSARSEVDGAFVLRGLPPGTYELRVTALGFIERRLTVVAENGRSVWLPVTLNALSPTLNALIVRARADTQAPGALVWDRARIDSSGRRDVGELLQDQPGITVVRRGAAGAASSVSIRGSAAGEVLVLLDGVPLNGLLTGDADLSQVALATVDRVTVLTGAQSARYGGQALAGVILIETRRSDDRESSARLVSGSWGERSASMTLNDARTLTVGEIQSAITGDLQSVGGDFRYAVPAVRGGGTATRRNADVRDANVTASASLDGAAGTLHARGQLQSTERGMPGSIVQPAFAAREHEGRQSVGAGGETHGAVVWSGEVHAEHQRSTFSDPAPTTGPGYDDRVDVSSTGFIGGVARARAGGEVAAGIDARLLDFTSTLLAPGAPRSQRLFGSWAQMRFLRRAFGDIALDGVASGRADWNSLLSGTAVSPRVALTASGAVLALSVSGGAAYNPPSLADQFFHEGVLARPNPDLKPERVSHELEARVTIHDTGGDAIRAGGDVAVYRADIHGMIIWVPDYRFVWSPSNFDVHRTGWDATAHVALPSVGAEARGSVSRVDVTYANPVLTGQVVYRPRTTASATVALSRAFARFELSGRYVGARRSVAGSSLNLLGAYGLADARVVAPMTVGHWVADIWLGVDDLLDRQAAMLPDYPYPGRTWRLGLRLGRAFDRAPTGIQHS